MAQPLAQLYAEHSSLGAVLNAMTALVREVRDHGSRIDPKVFRAILYYLDVFPEREHHRNEELVLFPRIRARTHAADKVLDQSGTRASGRRGSDPQPGTGVRALRGARR